MLWSRAWVVGWAKRWSLVAGRRQLLPSSNFQLPTSHFPDPTPNGCLIWLMYRVAHSAPDHPNPPASSTSDFHHHTSEQSSSTHLQPLMASRTHQIPISQGKHDHVAATPPKPGMLESGNASNHANAHRRKLASHYIHEGTSYDPSNAKEDYLRMAKDDVPDSKVSSASTPSAGACNIFGSLGARTLLGGPFLPLPPWCFQSHTLVSGIFLLGLQRSNAVPMAPLYK